MKLWTFKEMFGLCYFLFNCKQIFHKHTLMCQNGIGIGPPLPPLVDAHWVHGFCFLILIGMFDHSSFVFIFETILSGETDVQQFKFNFPNRNTWYDIQYVCSSFLEGGWTEKHSLSSCPPKYKTEIHEYWKLLIYISQILHDIENSKKEESEILLRLWTQKLTAVEL